MQLPQFDDEQKWPPAMTTLLLALEAALNSVMHSLPHAPFPAIASLLEDPLLLQAYQRPPQLNFQPQLSPRVQSYFRHALQPGSPGGLRQPPRHLPTGRPTCGWQAASDGDGAQRCA